MMTIILNGDGTTLLSLPIQYKIQPHLLEDDSIRRALEDIEHIYKIDGLAMYSTDHGVKSPERLSNGMKCLLLMTCYDKNDGLISNACMGANCGPYIAELSLKYDFTIAWDSFLDIPDDAVLDAVDYETGTRFHTGKELVDFYGSKPGDPEYCDW